jgi:uncharacterized protein YdaL
MNKFNQAIQYQIKQNSLHNIQKHIYVFFVILFSFLFFNSLIYSNQSDTKKILILTEGNTDLKSFAYADGRNLGELMGHFNTTTTIKGVNQYSKNELNNYDFIFYLGYHLKNTVPKVFLNDILATNKPVIWTYTGIVEFAKSYNLKKILGFP